ncbi:MAG: hypothetical protein J6M95_01640 [Bacilli bacterium]|nr:hypothetical protein [Bacilli bacterium]
MKKNYKLILGLAPALFAMGITACGQPQHTHTFVEHPEVSSNCVETGTEFYYTCEGCDKYFDANKEEIEAPVVIPVDPTNHKGDEFLVVGGTFKTAYKVDDTFDMTGLTLTLKCEHCAGRVLSDAEMKRVQVGYPTENASKFTADDLNSESLKMTFTYGELSVQTDVTLSKKDNAITGLAPLSFHCGAKAFTELDGVSATFGTIVYTFATSEDGEYKTKEQLGEEFTFTNEGKGESESTTYYLKATVADGLDYVGVEEKTTITVTHNDTSWDFSNEEFDVSGCICSDPVKFIKTVTNASQEVEVASTAALDLAGSSYDSTKHTIKSITYIKGENEYSLGTDLANLDFTNVPAEDHGEGKVEVVVSTPQEGVVPAADHTIKVDLLAVTKYIKTKEDVSSIRVQDIKENVFGYFKIVNDINVNSLPEVYWSNDPNQQGYKTFKGTLDGDGHTLTVKSFYLGFFQLAEDSVFKNINFVDSWSRNGFTANYSMLCLDLRRSLVENCTFTISASGSFEKIPNVENSGLIVSRISMDNTFKDCTFNFAGKDIGNLLGYGQNKVRNTFENCTLDCASYAMLWYNGYNKVYYYVQEGMTVNTGTINSYLEKQTIYVNHDENQAINLTNTAFEDEVATAIMLGTYDLGSDLSNLTLSSEFKDDLTIRGEQTLSITFQSGFTITMPVEVVFESIELDIASQDILVSATTKSVSLSGTEYDGDVVNSITLGAYDLGTDLANLNLPDELVNDKTKHGENKLAIKLTHDGATRNISIPVTVVTATISNATEWGNYLRPGFENIGGGDYFVADTYADGYFILSADITVAANINSGLTEAYAGDLSNRGFRGTLDGRGHKFTCTATYYNGGLFNVINGGTIKNITFDTMKVSQDGTRSTLAVQILNATIENVTFNFAQVNTNGGPASMFAVTKVVNTLYKDVTINAPGLDVLTVLGGTGSTTGIKCENVKLYSKSVKFWVGTTWGGTDGKASYDGCEWIETLS